MNKFLSNLILWLASHIKDHDTIKRLQRKLPLAYSEAHNHSYLSLQCPNCKQFTSRVNPAKHYESLKDYPYDAMVCGTCDHLSFWLDHGIVKDLPASERNPTVVILNSDISSNVFESVPDKLLPYVRKRLI